MDVQIVKINCIECNISFWITVAHWDNLKECHNTFYCPAGHSQYYPQKNDAEKVKKYKSLYNKKCEEIEKLSKSNAAYRGIINKPKRRITKATRNKKKVKL